MFTLSKGKVKGQTVVFDTDEHVKADTSLEKLAKLRPAFGATEKQARIASLRCWRSSPQSPAMTSRVVSPYTIGEQRMADVALEQGGVE